MLIEKPFLCIYCGDDADSLDHVLPWSFAEVIRRRKARAGKRAGLRVWSCRECNSLLGDKIFDCFLDRARHVNQLIRDRYRKALDTADCWSDEEVEGMGGTLKIAIRNYLLIGKYTKKRVD